jgi:hypothetical protein
VTSRAQLPHLTGQDGIPGNTGPSPRSAADDLALRHLNVRRDRQLARVGVRRTCCGRTTSSGDGAGRLGNTGQRITMRSCNVRYSADPVKALRGGAAKALSGGVGREFDDKVSVEGCADSLQQGDRGNDAAGFQA